MLLDQEVNRLTNLYVRACYSFHLLSGILAEDEHLQESAKHYERGSKIAKKNAQVLFDYLHESGIRFLLLDPQKLLVFDLKTANRLERQIKLGLRRLETMTAEETNEGLQTILEQKIIQITSSTSTKITLEQEREVKTHLGKSTREKAVRKERDGSAGKDPKADPRDLSNTSDLEHSKDSGQAVSDDSGFYDFGRKDLKAYTKGEEVQRERREEQRERRRRQKQEEVAERENGQVVEGENGQEAERETKEEAKTDVEKETAQAKIDDGGLLTYTEHLTLNFDDGPLCTDYKLNWQETPLRTVFIVKKLNESVMNDGFVKLIHWLQKSMADVTIIVQYKAFQELLEESHPQAIRIGQTCKVLHNSDAISKKNVDLVLSIGGDGTLLYVASLFPEHMPPVVAFRSGTLNYLVPFSFDEDEHGSATATLEKIIRSDRATVRLRHRIVCARAEDPDAPTYTAVNEVAVTRGEQPSLCKVDVRLSGRRGPSLARVEGDGLLLATPTGSTAYSLAAGGAVLHPSVPCLQLVPIAPHSICTRSLVLPANAQVELALAQEARGEAYVSIDGLHSFRLRKNERLRLFASPHPLPMVYLPDEADDGQDGGHNLLRSVHWVKKVKPPEEDKVAGGSCPDGGCQWKDQI